jgi:hypothetical protein
MRQVFRIGLRLVLAAVLFVGGGAFFFAVRTIDHAESAWKADVAAERARLAGERRPPLRGEARAANAAAEYVALSEKIAPELYESYAKGPDGSRVAGRARPVAKELGDTALAPAAPPPGAVAALLAAHADDLAALRDATRAERCDFGTEWERGAAAPIPNFLAMRALAGLLVLDGRARALAGDAAGAAERDLDCMRFGADVSTQGTTIFLLMGLALRGIGERNLVALVESGALDGPALAEVDRELAALDGLVAPLGAAVRGEWRENVPLWISLAREGRGTYGEPDAPRAPPVLRYFPIASLVRAEAGLRDDLVAVLDGPETRERFARVGEIEAKPRSWDPVARKIEDVSTPNWARLLQEACTDAARRRALRAAASVAAFRARTGELPAGLADCMGEVPKDPFDGAPLRYARGADGRSAKVWSVGEDLADDGGRPLDEKSGKGDIVLELGPPR